MTRIEKIQNKLILDLNRTISLQKIIIKDERIKRRQAEISLELYKKNNLKKWK